MAACATTTSFYGTRTDPSYIEVLAIEIADDTDYSELRDNEFLRQQIIDNITEKLNSIGIRRIVDEGGKQLPTHVLRLSSRGVREQVRIRPVQTTESYHSGIDSQGQLHTYSAPNVSGGGSYRVRKAQVTATLFQRSESGALTKISQSFASGDGQDLVERWVRSATIIPDKQLGRVYMKTFTDAAISLFAK